MKKFMTILSLTALLGMGHAYSERPALKFGTYTAVPTGGQMNDSDFVYGLQGEIGLSKHFALEMAYIDGLENRQIDLHSRIDKFATMDMESSSLALSLIGRFSICERMRLFALGGINYHFFDAQARPDINPAAPHSIDAQADNALGYQAGLGASVSLLDSLELFCEYRHTFTELETHFDVQQTSGLPFIEKINDSENIDYGLFKIGLNLAF